MLIFVRCVHDLKQEVLNLEQGYTLYALKFAKLARLSVQSTHLIMLLAKCALKRVKNVLTFVKNLQRHKHNLIGALLKVECSKFAQSKSAKVKTSIVYTNVFSTKKQLVPIKLMQEPRPMVQ